MKILVTGGAGYIGSILFPELLNQGHAVCIYDNLLFGGNSLLPYIRNPNFSFIKGDIRDSAKFESAAKDKDIIIHLAAIVGFPACKKRPDYATQVNVDATREMIKKISKDQYVLFASTGSTYGVIEKEICTEKTPLHPASLYAQTKKDAEIIIMENCTATTYRFATAFGLSPRLRLDLLVNDFVFKAITQRYIVVYESQFMRTFIHVYDIARSFLFAIDNINKMSGETYNVGSDKMNYSKRDICEIISEKIDYYLHLADYETDLDKRNYIVSYDKINTLGYDTTIDLKTGIDELIVGIDVINIPNPFSNA